MKSCSLSSVKSAAKMMGVVDKMGNLPKNKPNGMAVNDFYAFENKVRFEAISKYGLLPEGIKSAMYLNGREVKFNRPFFDWVDKASPNPIPFPTGMYVFRNNHQNYFVYSRNFNGSIHSQVFPFEVGTLQDMYGYSQEHAELVYAAILKGEIREKSDSDLENIVDEIRAKANDVSAMFNKSEIHNLQDAIDASFDISEKNSVEHALLKYMVEKGGRVFKGINFDVTLYGTTLNSHGVMGSYNPRTKTVSVDPVAIAMSRNELGKTIPMLIAHEAIHTITVNQLSIYQHFVGTEELEKHLSKQEIEACKELVRIYEKVKGYSNSIGVTKIEQYGLTDVYEMVSEAATNGDFRDYLDAISDKVVDEQDRSLLTKIFNAIGRIINRVFGMGESELTDLINGLSIQLIEAQNTSNYENMYRVIQKENLFSEHALKADSDIKDLTSLLKNNGSHYRYSEEELTKRFIRKITNPLNTKRELKMFGQVFHFNGLSDAQIEAKVKNEIIERIMSFEANVIDNMVKWLNDGADKAKYGQYMGTTYRDHEHPDINQRLATHILLDHLEFDFNEKVYRLDSKEVKDLGINIPGFVGFNPMVLVHDTPKGEKAITLMDVTNIPINERTVDGLFDNVKKWMGIDVQNQFKGNELGLRRFLLTLTSMAIKAQNPNVTIRKAGVIQVAGKASKLMSSHINLQEAVLDVQELVKSPEIKTLLGEKVAAVLDTPGIFDPEKYDINYVSWFMHWSRAKQQAIKDNGILVNEETTFSETERNQAAWRFGMYADHLGKLISEDNTTEEMLTFFINRQKFLENYRYSEHTIRPEIAEQMNNDKEYQLVSQSIIQLSKMLTNGGGRMKDITKAANYLVSQQNMRNPIGQYAMASLQEGMQRTRTRFMQVNEKLTDMWKGVDNNFFLLNPEKKYVAEKLTDLSSERFKRLFKKQKVNTEGGITQVITDKIHWNKNDAETKEALRLGEILPEDVEYGRIISEQFKNSLIRSVAHSYMQERKSLEVMSKADYEALKTETLDLATKEVESKYEMGRVLVLSKTAKELFFSGNFKGSWQKFLDDSVNPDRYFTEGNESDILTSVDAARFYTNQLLSDEEEHSRLEKFGMEMKDSEIYLTNPAAIEMMSQDLETSLKLFVMSVEKTVQVEDYILPRINAARSALFAYEGSRGEKMEQTREYILRRFNLLINGKSDLDKLKEMTVTVPFVDKPVSPVKSAIALQGMTIFGSLALNIGSGITATGVNTLGVLANAIANTSSPYMAGPAEIAAAIKEFATNHDKVVKVVTKYQLVDTDTMQLLHGDRKGIHTEFNKDVWSSHVFQWLNWAPDYAARCVTSVAQMIKDGTWQAIDENGVYNEDLDPRYKEKDGQLLREFRKKKLIEEGHMEPTAKKLTMPYIDKEIFAIRDQSSQHVVGGYMSDERSNSAYKIYGRLFDTYKVWLKNKLTNFYSEGYYRDASGRLTTKDGKVIWEQEYFEGKLQSLGEAAKIFKKHYSNPIQAWHELQQLQPRQKQNLKRLMIDTMLFTVLTMAFRGAFDDDDKPGNVILGRTINSNSLLKSLYYVSQDLTNEWYPPALMDLVSEPFAVITYAKKLALLSEALVTFDSDRATRELLKVTPFMSSVKYIDNLIEE